MKRRLTFKQSLPGLHRIIGRFWPEIRKHRLLMAGSFLALLAEIGFRALEPLPLKLIFDGVFVPKHGGGKFGSVPFLDTLYPPTLLAISALAIILFSGLRDLAEYANTIGFAKIGSRILTQVRAQVFRHLQGLSLAFHTRARSGKRHYRHGCLFLLKWQPDHSTKTSQMGASSPDAVGRTARRASNAVGLARL